MRVIFYAEPEDPNLDSSNIKSIPDFESHGSVWASYEEIMAAQPSAASGQPSTGTGRSTFYLRGDEPQVWADYLEKNGRIHDMDILKETKKM